MVAQLVQGGVDLQPLGHPVIRARSTLTTQGPIVDVGAGTGFGVDVIAGVLPDARIPAIEPSVSLRSGSFTRVMLRTGLHRSAPASDATSEPRPDPDPTGSPSELIDVPTLAGLDESDIGTAAATADTPLPF